MRSLWISFSLVCLTTLVSPERLAAQEAGQADLAVQCSDAYLKEDYGRAFSPCRARARAGDAVAQMAVGYMYKDGTGVPQDYASAAFWFRKVADNGNPWGQSALGILYFQGQGVPKDYVQAHKWLNLSVAGGNVSSRALRDSIESMMSSAQVSEAQRLARNWRPN